MKKIAAILIALVCSIGSATEAIAYVTSEQETQNSPQADSLPNDWRALSDEVDNLLKRVQVANPVGTKEEQQKQFYMLHQEINQMDNKIDLLEDKARADYAAGKITWDEYRKIDNNLDTLDKRLDRAEDRLEKRFGIDD